MRPDNLLRAGPQDCPLARKAIQCPHLSRYRVSMSAKFDQFMKALEALCRKHGCQLAPSGYDTIDVWDLQDGESPVYGGVVDETKDV